MTCDECQKMFVIERRQIHLPDTDGVIDVMLTTDEAIGYHQFVGAIEQLYKELAARFRVESGAAE